MELNIRTLYLIGGIVTTTGAGAALLTWYHHRTAPGLRAWAFSLMLTSIGAAMIRFRLFPTEIGLTLAADAVVIYGMAVMWMSLRYYNQARSDHFRLLAFAGVVAAAFLAVFVLAKFAGVARQTASIPFSLFLGGLALAAAREIWKGHAKDHLRSRLPTALSFGGMALSRLVRAATLALEEAGALEPGTAAYFHPYTLYAAVVFTVVITYCLVMMANERAVRLDEEIYVER